MEDVRQYEYTGMNSWKGWPYGTTPPGKYIPTTVRKTRDATSCI
jgi:hypothetical protein